MELTCREWAVVAAPNKLRLCVTSQKQRETLAGVVHQGWTVFRQACQSTPAALTIYLRSVNLSDPR